MIGQLLKGLITDPGNAIVSGKHEHNMKQTWTLLGIEWAIAAISVFIAGDAVGNALGSFKSLATMLGGVAAIAVLIGGILVTVFIAFLLKVTVNTLGGKGTYFDGLSVLAYMIWPLALGGLLASILLMIPALGAFLAGLSLAFLGVLAGAIAFRSIKEMFGVDYITALIALAVLGIGLNLAAAAATSVAAATLALNFVQMLKSMLGTFQLPTGMTLPGIIPG